MKTKLGILIFFVFFLLSSLIGYYLYSHNKTHAKISLINPLLRYTNFKELSPFRHKVEALIAQQKENSLADEVAVYFRSLSDGIWFGIEERELFCPASLLKVPIMMAYLKTAENNPSILKKMLRYKIYPDSLSQNIKPFKHIKNGYYVSIDDLINLMIADSDNNACKTLVSNIDQSTLHKIFEELGLISFH